MANVFPTDAMYSNFLTGSLSSSSTSNYSPSSFNTVSFPSTLVDTYSETNNWDVEVSSSVRPVAPPAHIYGSNHLAESCTRQFSASFVPQSLLSAPRADSLNFQPSPSNPEGPSFPWTTMMVADHAGVVNFAASSYPNETASFNNGFWMDAGIVPGGAASIDSHSVVPVSRCKRKALDTISVDEPAVKIHINEDRMATCMSDLHLDNNNLEWHPDLEEEPWYTQQKQTATSTVNNNNDGVTLNGTSHPVLPRRTRRFEINENSTLELCAELSRGLKNKDILPQVILDELNKSNMQVMLWRPPGECITKCLRQNSQLLDNTSAEASSRSAYSSFDNEEDNAKESQSSSSSSLNTEPVCSDMISSTRLPVLDCTQSSDFNMEF